MDDHKQGNRNLAARNEEASEQMMRRRRVIAFQVAEAGGQDVSKHDVAQLSQRTVPKPEEVARSGGPKR
jgi:hypothetical protein